MEHLPHVGTCLVWNTCLVTFLTFLRPLSSSVHHDHEQRPLKGRLALAKQRRVGLELCTEPLGELLGHHLRGLPN